MFLVHVFLFLTSIFLFNFSAFSLECPDRLEARQLTQLQQILSKDDTCYLSVSGRNNYQTLVYRDYLFSSKGALMAFLSFGPGPDATKTGSKEFYFFPRQQKDQSYFWNDEKAQLVIRSTVNFDFFMDTYSSDILTVSNAIVQVDPKISPDNNGGITMWPLSGLIYELPFQLGKAPSSVPSLRGEFRDSQKRTCRVKVYDVFKKIGDDSVFKYNDEQLSRYLKTKCPQLKSGF